MSFVELYQDAVTFKGEESQKIELEGSPEYSIVLWINISRITKERQSTLLLKGSQGQQQPQISLFENTLWVKFDISQSVSESIFGSTSLVAKQWIMLTFTMQVSEITEASLFINGKLDSQISIRKTPLSNSGPVYIGKDPWSHGFKGTIAEPLYFFHALTATEVEQMWLYGVENWNRERCFSMATAFGLKQDVSSISLKMLEEDEESPEKSRVGETFTGPSINDRLENFFRKNPKIFQQATEILPNIQWLMVIYKILRNSYPVFKDDDGNILNLIEIDRMMLPLKEISIKLKKKEILNIAKAMKCVKQISYSSEFPSWYEKETDEIINFVEFLEGLKNFIEIPTHEFSSCFDISTINSAAEDYGNNTGGNIELSIDYCKNCSEHQTTTWHDENEYAAWYNEVFKDLTEEFPSCDIIGNKYGPPSIGTFAVFIEGVGPTKLKDSFGRYCLYRIKNSQPNSRKIIDAVTILAFEFENVQELASKQAEYRKIHEEHPKHPESHTELAPIKEKNTHTVKHELEYDFDQEMVCKNWGCLTKLYKYGRNHNKACRFHPGRWEFGSIHSLWPEHWTCCRGNWDAIGCSLGPHRGVPNERVRRECINRGEVNPKTLKPDSFCGAMFLDPATCGKKYNKPKNPCKYHSGYIEKPAGGLAFWTCCNAEIDPQTPEISYCVEEDHRFAEYPDEEAKIYFVTKSDINVNFFKESGKNCRFYNPDIKPYESPYSRKKEKPANENEIRYCLNYTCESTYTEAANHKFACRCHPGKWDFGHSGSRQQGETVELWGPHWKCCGRRWDDFGCVRTRHKGPIAATMPERKYKWPSEQAQWYFHKQISSLWRAKLDREQLSEEEVSEKYDQFCKDKRIRKLSSDYLLDFCNLLKIEILSLNDDNSFMIKYEDVISREAESLLADRNGDISKEKFMEWWFGPLESEVDE